MVLMGGLILNTHILVDTLITEKIRQYTAEQGGGYFLILLNTHSVLGKNLSTQELELQYRLQSQLSRMSGNGVRAASAGVKTGTMTPVTHMVGTGQDRKILRMPKIYSLTLTTP